MLKLDMQQKFNIINSFSKVIVDAECRIMTNIAQQELQSYKKRIVLNVFIVLLLCVIGLVVIWCRVFFPCDSDWLFFWIWLFSFVSFSILLYYLLKVNNVDESR
jgi:Fe2+ transport system protein B